jgi:hypothetical protein
VDPGTVFADVDELEEVLVQTGFLAGVLKQGLVGARGAGSHNDPIQIVLSDSLFDRRQPLFGATVHVVLGVGHVGEGADILHHLRDAHYPADVVSTVTDEYAYASFFHAVILLADPSESPPSC